jgi:carboxylate-amine ligase
VPRAFESFADFEALAELMGRAADVPDYTWFWWKLRPHPRLGTVEVRSLDAQTTPEETAALAALVHCLARHWAERETPAPAAPELLEEGLFRAARFGTDAELPDADGRPRPLPDVLAETLELCAEAADELGCADELQHLTAMAARGGGAGRQRQIQQVSGMDTLLRELVSLTAGAAGD